MPVFVCQFYLFIKVLKGLDEVHEQLSEGISLIFVSRFIVWLPHAGVNNHHLL